MAGIEQIVVHSKSYLVRWIQVAEHQSISWSVQPHKKSINFGVFKHPGTKNGLTPQLPTTQESFENTAVAPTATPNLDGAPQNPRGHRGSISKNDNKNDSSLLIEKLQAIGLKSVAWQGKCEADKVSMGRYDVPAGEGGMYGLLFDNTFSKQTGKTITFVLMTHPTNAPPKSGHHLHYSQAFATGSSTNVGGRNVSPSLQAINASSDSLPSESGLHRAMLEDPRPRSRGGRAVESKGPEGSTFYTGVLHKKRRKKGQGFARRFFSLDFTSSTLSYYRDRHSSALRGAIPLSLAAIGANEKTREFSVDSGAEVWHLKATNSKEFDGWKDALERASASGNVPSSETPTTPAMNSFIAPTMSNFAEEQEWERVQQLVSMVAGTRDAVRGLAKDTDPKYMPGVGLGLSTSNGSGSAISPASFDLANSYFQDADEKSQEKRPAFWKRKTSGERRPATLMQRSVSAHLGVASPSSVPLPTSPGGALQIPKRSRPPPPALPQEDVHERCMALLRNLDVVVGEFSALIAENKMRRKPLGRSSTRMSLESTSSQEFFDAEDDSESPSQLFNIRRSSELGDGQETQISDQLTEVDSDTSSEAGDDVRAVRSSLFIKASQTAHPTFFPPVSQALPPLPMPPVKRRATLQPPRQPPPSIIGFLRKNAGKDLSTVSMPVTANEPTSLLQRMAEVLEYPQLLDAAAAAATPEERLAYVAAFAISGFSNNRVNERAIRKPFNPMLGETYELVREDLGFRFLAEKVSHHPVRMACQAESLTNGGWCFSQSPQPVQKFWGKSVELNTEGPAHVLLYAVDEGKGEHYSWSQATCFLRNVIVGEKYVEPVQTMTVVNETNGMRAVATFKTGGMFSGRSEEVSVQLFDREAPLSLGLVGKWTESLKRTDTGATLWTAGPLVANAAKVYGFTSFAASLNEITDNEAGHLAPTDSRLRPDQRALEVGEVDQAEAVKARLEERQRARRKLLETHGQTWTPRFFEKVSDAGVDGEETWRLKQKAGYWERREKGDWSGVQEVFEV